MRILIVSFSIGGSPVGKVNENLINGLAKAGHQLLVVCAYNLGIINGNVSLYKLKPQFRVSNKLVKLTTIFFHKGIEYAYWAYKIHEKLKSKIHDFQPEIVFTLGYRGGDSSINLGMKWAKMQKIPYAIHLVDPIPPPKGWETYEVYRKSVVKPIKDALQFAHLLSMNNPEMLSFQQSNLNFNILNKSFILPDPIVNTKNVLGPPGNKKIISFLGSFYSARKPESLIKGFAKYCEKGNNAELHIIGKNNIDLEIFGVSKEIQNKIILMNWTNDIDKVCKESTILVDVDADLPNDVFISSKLKEYLALDRVILSITRENSPARNFLKNIKDSIVFSDHNYLNVAEAIEKAFDTTYDFQIFKERKEVIDVLDINNIVDNVISNFEKIISEAKK